MSWSLLLVNTFLDRMMALSVPKGKKEDQIYAIMHVVREKVVTLAPGPHATLPSLG